MPVQWNRSKPIDTLNIRKPRSGHSFCLMEWPKCGTSNNRKYIHQHVLKKSKYLCSAFNRIRHFYCPAQLVTDHCYLLLLRTASLLTARNAVHKCGRGKERLRCVFLKYVPRKYQNKKQLSWLLGWQTGLTTLTDPDLEVFILEVLFWVPKPSSTSHVIFPTSFERLQSFAITNPRQVLLCTVGLLEHSCSQYVKQGRTAAAICWLEDGDGLHSTANEGELISGFQAKT